MPNRRVPDLTGEKYNKLTILARVFDNRGRSRYKCLCICGNTILVSPWRLTHNVTRSCGCARKDDSYHGGKPRTMSRQKKAHNDVVGYYRRNAKRRGIEMSLTIEEMDALFKGCCVYCGCPPSQIYYSRDKEGEFRYNGIDRVDNNKGYIRGNCVSCCRLCNIAKGQMSRNVFLTHIANIYRHSVEVVW